MSTLQMNRSNRETSRQAAQIELHRRLAQHYDRRYEPGYSQIFQHFWNETLMELCSPKAESYVLDLGCGNGILLQTIEDHRCLPFGLDISFEMVNSARTRAGNRTSLMVSDANTLPLSSSSIDAVICRGVLHHVPNLDLTFREVHRVLKPGGVWVFSEPSDDSFIVRAARSILYRKSDRFDEKDKGFRQSETEEMIRQLRLFDIIRVQRFGFLAYALAGFPDHLPVLKWVPFNRGATRVLIRLDRFLSTVPFMNKLSLHMIFVLKKRGNA